MTYEGPYTTFVLLLIINTSLNVHKSKKYFIQEFQISILKETKYFENRFYPYIFLQY